MRQTETKATNGLRRPSELQEVQAFLSSMIAELHTRLGSMESRLDMKLEGLKQVVGSNVQYDDKMRDDFNTHNSRSWLSENNVEVNKPSASTRLLRTSTMESLEQHVPSPIAVVSGDSGEKRDPPPRHCASELSLGAGISGLPEALAGLPGQLSSKWLEERKRKLMKTQFGLKMTAGTNFADSWAMSRALWLTRNNLWIGFCTFLAVLNAAFIGVESDWQAKWALSEVLYRDDQPSRAHAQDYDHVPFIVANYIFVAWLVLEVSLNLYAQRCRYFGGPDVAWNILDMLILFASVMDIVLESFNFTFLKALRVFRLGSVLRTVRFVKYFHGVKKMFISITGSMLALFSAFLMVFVIMYMVSIVMLRGVSYVPSLEAVLRQSQAEAGTNGHVGRQLAIFQWSSEDLELRQLEQLYGGLGRVLLTLFRAISGGLEWGFAAEPLTKVSGYYGVIWTLYMACMVIGVMNVLTGTFVQQAFAAADSDREIAIEDEQRSHMAMRQVMLDIFIDADTDESGAITKDEFTALLQDNDVKMLLRRQGVDTTDADRVFNLLDKDDSGQLAADEFVNGVLSIQGGAKSVDMLANLIETRKILTRLDRLDRFFRRSPSSRSLHSESQAKSRAAAPAEIRACSEDTVGIVGSQSREGAEDAAQVSLKMGTREDMEEVVTM